MKKTAGLIIIMILVNLSIAFCQSESPKQTMVESILGEYITELPENTSKGEIIDYLVHLIDNPLNLNHCSRQELRSLPFLTEYHINNFIYYRNRYGWLMSIYELKTIEGYDQELIEKLLLFCNLHGKTTYLNSNIKADQQLVLKFERALQQKQGYKSDINEKPKYVGDPNKFFVRYDYSKRGGLDFGITLEKDPGERLTFSPKSKHYLFDYTSFFLSVKNKGSFKNIIIGDYRIQSGQGLVFGSSFSFGKSSDVISIGKNYNSGIRAYQSSFENKSFSGLGISIAKGRFQGNIMASYVSRDATIKIDDDLQYLESLRTNGYHRTDSELNSRKTVMEKNLGLNVEYQNTQENLRIGMNYLFSHFSLPFRKKSSPESIYDFTGQKSHIGSFYADYSLGGTYFFGELAQNIHDGSGLLAGLTHHVHGSIFLSALYRNYSKDFHSFHGNGFSENSGIKNEKGIYVGFKFSPIKHLNAEIYLDKYEHPWLKHGLGRPTKGNDLLLKLKYSKYKVFDAYVILRSKLEDKSELLENEKFENFKSFAKNRYTLNLKIYPNTHWTFQQRVQLSNFKFFNTLTRGFLLSTRLNYTKNNIVFSLAFSTFDSDDFENSQYIYVRTVPYSYSVPSFHGKGSNMNIFIQYKISKQLSLHTSFNQSYYPYLKEIGAGNEKVIANKKSLARLMLIFSF